MDMKLITYILTIAQEGGITKAANKLFITQSALDQQLLKLEGELGVQLFYRQRGNLGLTPAGEVYVDYARRILSLQQEAYRKIHDLADQKRGTLSLAFAPERGMEMFANVYPQFYALYPEMNVLPQELNVKRQIELLLRDELDLGFLTMKEPSLPALVCRTLLTEEFVLITPLDHPLAKKAAPKGEPLATVDFASLEHVTFCLMSRTSTQREMLDPLFAAHNFRPNIFLETASNRTNVAMVQNGMCCSIVPYYYAKDNPNIACFRLSCHPTWNLVACHRRNRYLPMAAEDFVELARRYFEGESGDLQTCLKRSRC